MAAVIHRGLFVLYNENMSSYASILILAILGLSETVYLYGHRRMGTKPICVIGKETCHSVLESQYNSFFFGIPNEITGFFFYFGVAVMAVLFMKVAPFAEVIKLGLTILVVSGVLISLALTYLQWRVIKAWCFWCLVSALTIFLMAILVAFSYF